MLMLTRREGESIAIGDDILIVVSKLRRTQVRLGIEAPRQVNIARSELDGAPEIKTTEQASLRAIIEVHQTAIDSMRRDVDMLSGTFDSEAIKAALSAIEDNVPALTEDEELLLKG